MNTSTSRWPVLSARACVLIAAAALLLPPLAALATRAGLVGYRLGIPVAGIALLAACLGLVVVLLLLCLPALREQRRSLCLSLLLFAAPALLAVKMFVEASGLPVIHDISTDLLDPPQYRTAPGLRQAGENSLLTDPGVLAAQADAYPDIAPLMFDAPAAEVFALALLLSNESGWDITRVDHDAQEIEAVAMTFWYGFRDDVIIRLRADGPRTRVDLRSSSRVGRSDIGANARRIREFLASLVEAHAGKQGR